MPIVSISINLSLAQNLNLLAGNFLLMPSEKLNTKPDLKLDPFFNPTQNQWV